MGMHAAAAFGAALTMAVGLGPAMAELAVSANDGKATLRDGAPAVNADVIPDSVTILDLSSSPPRVVAEVEAPASVAGPPVSVAIAPDESFALVTAAQALDPADRTKLVPDDKLSVIDLKANPPRVAATLQAGRGAAGVSINRAGTLALVANRSEGTVSVFTIKGGALSPAGKIKLGDEKSGPSAIAFTRDGTAAYVTRDGDDRISVLTVDGDKVEDAKRVLYAGLRPYGIDIAGSGDLAVVANIGRGGGDIDTISVIDLKAKPSRVVNTVSVGQSPEAVKMSPDGRHVAVVVINGSNRATTSPFYNRHSLLQVYRLSGRDLTQVAEAQLGHWCQGAAWSRDGRTLVSQCMIERELYAFAFDGAKLTPTGTIKLKNGPAAIRTAEP
jgi:DNA-binding beta-propeller fold protein YncE